MYRHKLEAACRQFFQDADRDGGGSISPLEFSKHLKETGKQFQQHKGHSRGKSWFDSPFSIYQKIDVDGSGAIDENEFVEFVLNNGDNYNTMFRQLLLDSNPADPVADNTEESTQEHDTQNAAAIEAAPPTTVQPPPTTATTPLTPSTPARRLSRIPHRNSLILAHQISNGRTHDDMMASTMISAHMKASSASSDIRRRRPPVDAVGGSAAAGDAGPAPEPSVAAARTMSEQRRQHWSRLIELAQEEHRDDRGC